MNVWKDSDDEISEDTLKTVIGNISAKYRRKMRRRILCREGHAQKSIIWVMLNLRFRKNWKFSQNLNAFADRGVGGRTRREQVIICRRKCMRKITLNFLVVFMLISCFEIRSTVALRVVRLRANSCTVVLRPGLSSKFRRRSGGRNNECSLWPGSNLKRRVVTDNDECSL